MNKLRVKDVFSPVEGIFALMPDDIWNDVIDSEDLDIELYTKYGDLLASPLVRFYHENKTLDELSSHLYRKHSRSWEQIKEALHEEYNMFLTSRMNEEITNTTLEKVKGTNSATKGVDSTSIDEGESDGVNSIDGKIRVTNDNLETHDREDINDINRTEGSVSELDVDRKSEVTSENVRESDSETNKESNETNNTTGSDKLTIDKTQKNVGTVKTTGTDSESGNIKRTGTNTSKVTDNIDESNNSTSTKKVTHSGTDVDTVTYNSGESGTETTNKSGSEVNNVTSERTPNLTEQDINTTNYGKTTTNSGKQKNDSSEQVFGFGSSDPTDLNKSSNVREDDNLKETLGGTDKVTNTKNTTGTESNTTSDTLTFNNRQDKLTSTRSKNGNDKTSTQFGKVENLTGSENLTKSGLNKKDTTENINEKEDRNLSTSKNDKVDTDMELTDTGSENRTTQNETINSIDEDVTSNEVITDSGSETTLDTGSETTTRNDETVGQDKLTQTGTVSREDENVTEYEDYEESQHSSNSNVRTDNLSESVSGENKQDREVTHTQETRREADSPLSTTQSLVHEEIEMRMKYNLLDLILETIRKDISLKVWRY